MADEYSKFTITSKKDRYSHGYDIPDYERDMKAIVNQAVKSALSEGGYFKTSSRVVDKTTGETKLDIYVHTADAKVVEDSIKNELNKLTFRDSKGRVTQRPKYEVATDTLTDKEQKIIAKEERAQDRGEGEVSRFNRGTFLKIVGLLTSILTIARRILSSVMSFSQQTVKDMVTAHNLGMSYESVRSYRHAETAHGMKEGTITGAVTDIQTKFGNITSLDEKALEALAVVMGGKIEEMAKMGLGASNPEKILGAILDDFNAKANAGYNSVGQYVGEAQARRELYSYLLKVSPQVADIFATMQEEQHNINSIYRNQAETFEQWKNLRSPDRGYNPSPAERNVVVTMGQEWNNLKDVISQLKETIALTLAPTLTQIIRRLANVRWGLSESEKIALDKENRKANEEAIERYTSQLGLLGNSEADYQRGLALNYFIKKLKKENEKTSNIANLGDMTEDEIVVWGQKLRQDEIKEAIMKGGILSKDKGIGYSPAMKTIVDTYVPADELNAYREKYQTKAEEEAIAEAEKKKDEREQRRFNEAVNRISKNSAFQRESRELYDKLRNPYAPNLPNEGLSQAHAYLEARYLYGAKLDPIRYDENGKERPLFDQIRLAIKGGYIESSGGVTPSWSVSSAKFKKGLTEEEREEAIAGAMDDAEFYMKAYNLFTGNNDPFNLMAHLYGLLSEEVKEKAKEGTSLYDLDVLQRKYGVNLSGMSALFDRTYTGSGNILSYTTNENGIVTHKIVFDLNNNGKPEATDILLESYNTNRESDTGVIDTVTISNGRVVSTGSSASQTMKK